MHTEADIKFLKDLVALAKAEGLICIKWNGIEIHRDPTAPIQPKIATPEEQAEAQEWLKKLEALSKPVTDDEILFGTKRS